MVTNITNKIDRLTGDHNMLLDGYSHLNLICNPTGNCQTATIRYADQLTRLQPNQINDIFQKFGKRQFIIDIRKFYFERFLEAISKTRLKQISKPTEYKSRTGNEMIVCVFKFEKLCN